jgi:hypothetical protein
MGGLDLESAKNLHRLIVPVALVSGNSHQARRIRAGLAAGS